MTLVEHLRELRNRLFVSFVAIAVASIVGWVFYEQLFTFLTRPFELAADQLVRDGHPRPILSITGVADAFNLRLEVALATGFVLASPVWIYQLVRFVTPGLRKNERRWAALVALVAVPLFLAGVAVAYLSMTHVLGAFLGFTPTQADNIIPVDAYIGFLLQVSLAFGLGFLAPVVIVALNFMGVLSARRFASWWRWVLFGTLVFAAVATPTADPWNLLLFASPLLVLMVVAFVICWLNDRRRARRYDESDLAGLSDDEISPLPPPLPDEDVREDLHEIT
jgi:sec-independent protein translocase protein TatC